MQELVFSERQDMARELFSKWKETEVSLGYCGEIKKSQNRAGGGLLLVNRSIDWINRVGIFVKMEYQQRYL